MFEEIRQYKALFDKGAITEEKTTLRFIGKDKVRKEWL